MERISSREVELTNEEMLAKDHFDLALDQGMGIPDAVKNTKEWYPWCSDEFYAYLGE